MQWYEEIMDTAQEAVVYIGMVKQILGPSSDLHYLLAGDVVVLCVR